MEQARDDSDLVRRISGHPSGAPDAETELCRRFAPRAQLYGLKHLRDPDRARDLAQAVMVAVLVAVREGKVIDPGRIDRFVLGTCRNIAIRMREIDARTQPTEDAELEARAGAAPVMETLDKGALHGCLRKLDSRARSVVYLSFHEQQSAEEIAVDLETTPGNVRVLRHRAVAQLRRCLDEAGEAPR